MAGHSKINISGEYNMVQWSGQDELTCKIQDLRSGTTTDKQAVAAGPPLVPPALAASFSLFPSNLIM